MKKIEKGMQLDQKLFVNAACSNQPEVLNTIHQKEISIVIYQRDIQALQKDLSVAIQQDFAWRASGELHEINTTLASFFKV